MAGDDEDSWKNVLAREGFDVKVVLKGLGEYQETAEIFYEHSKKSTRQKEM
jgi:sirohydrochlorin cobaltochelatase